MSQHSRLSHFLRASTMTSVMALIMTGCTASTTDQTSDEISSEASSAPAIADRRNYADGTYAATGNYTSPAGVEEVGITLTLVDDVVTEAEFDGKATHPTSKKLQGMFSQGFAEEVVGKSIDDISLTVVNGSSLAPKGFMDALEKVKVEAAA